MNYMILMHENMWHVITVFVELLKIWVHRPKPLSATTLLQSQQTRNEWKGTLFANALRKKAVVLFLLTLLHTCLISNRNFLNFKSFTLSGIHTSKKLQDLQPCPHPYSATSIQLSCWVQEGCRMGVLRRITVVKSVVSWPGPPFFICARTF